MKFDPNLDEVHLLDGSDGLPKSCHRFERRDVHAVQAAMACRRPLLVRGEPGIGKSQLARAAASVMKVPFLHYTMTAESECRDLLYSFDAVERLAQAQVLSRVGEAASWRQDLATERFVLPGVLWWALNWTSATAQCKAFFGDDEKRAQSQVPLTPKDWRPAQGAVLLIDEIDKADGDVPNALLESLGSFSFAVPEAATRVGLAEGCPAPLVVITTNEERELPRAFLRRCLVLQMEFDRKLMLDRGKDHFGDAIDPDVYVAAADQLEKDRGEAPRFGPVTPGLAEYLDLLRILEQRKGKEAQLERLGQVRDFVGAKNPKQHRRDQVSGA